MLTINFDKLNGLIPVCVQDYQTMQLLMLGFMNKQAFEQTIETQRVTFYSRSKEKIWVKGETSGNYLTLMNYALDCDQDTLLIYAKANGPTCHTGSVSCFNTGNESAFYWLAKLIEIIDLRYKNPQAGSYTAQLFQDGIKRMAQKVGEEGVEVALAALGEDKNELVNEVADLLFHLFVLLRSKQIDFQEIADVIKSRMHLE